MAVLAVGLSMVVAGCGGASEVIQSGVMGVNAQAGAIRLLSVHVEAPPQPRYLPGDDARVWLTVVNSGARPDALQEVTSPVADEVQIHWDQNCDGQFTTVSTLPLPPAKPALRVAPAGAVPFDAYHLEMVGLTEEVLAGTSVSLTLRFERAGPVTVRPPIQPHDTPRAEPSTWCTS